MDSVFNIGGPELVFILLLAGIVMGPGRIQKAAHWLGRMTAQLQVISRGFARQLNAELAAVDEGGELKSSFNEIQELRRQLNDLKKEITSVAMSPAKEVESTMSEARQMLNNSIMPPKLAADNETEDAAKEIDLSSDADEVKTAVSASPPPPAALPSLIDIADDPE